MDMALTHTLNAFALPLLVVAASFAAVKGCLILGNRGVSNPRPEDSPATPPPTSPQQENHRALN